MYKSAARHKFDMVWLYRSPSQWGGGGRFTRSNDFYLPSLRLEDGGGGSAPCGPPVKVAYGTNSCKDDIALVSLFVHG
jgi:hypothetical protein